MVFRSKHFCQNEAFVSNFIKLFLSNYPPFMEHPLVHFQDIIDTEVAQDYMTAFVIEIQSVNPEKLLSKLADFTSK
jgi:hypothetical protein